MDIRDNEGWTALHAAASCGSVEIAQWVHVCFIHFIVISSWTGLAFGLNRAGWKSTTVSGISWTFSTISLNVVHGYIVNLYRVSKHARNFVQILEGFFFDVWILRSKAPYYGVNFCLADFPSNEIVLWGKNRSHDKVILQSNTISCQSGILYQMTQVVWNTIEVLHLRSSLNEPEL